MIKRVVLAVATGSLVIVLAACSSDSSTGPSSNGVVNIAGNWKGALTDNVDGSGEEILTMTLTQSGATVNGTWTRTPANKSGTILGTVANGTLSGSMTQVCNESTATATVSGAVTTTSVSLSSAAGFIDSTSGCIDGRFSISVGKQ